MQYTHRFRVQAPLAGVAEFHGSTDVLRQLMPPPLILQLHQFEPLADGSLAEFTIWAGPLPIRWQAEHSQVSETGFTDTQVKGPFSHWQHRHGFEIVDEHTTDIVDEVEAELGRGPLWWPVSLGMWLTLPILFAYRGWATRRAVERAAK
ncbi:MAG: cyclase [Chloroflexi bacterium]|nr:MAG: cyclase [Chloroflexota bacterium]NOH14587.1 cyclase [Chloroflexota bacterium]